MKVGTLCYATSRGLGHLARDFYKHGIITHPIVIKHNSVPTNEDWYPGAPQLPITALHKSAPMHFAKEFCRGMDAMLFFETPFIWDLIPWCAGIGVPTFLITMYECTPKTSPRPYKYICPSLLDVQYFPSGVYLPLPVEYPWKLRDTAIHFVHNGGYLGLRGREGTAELVHALPYIRSPLTLTIRCQERLSEDLERLLIPHKRVEYIHDTVPYPDLYGTGNVAIFPQKFNGCSLPVQEAAASGMLVMCSDRFPMNTWLPPDPLIPVKTYQTVAIGGAYMDFQEAIIDPQDIAATIDYWYGKDITWYSNWGKQWAEQHSWEVLKPRYLEVLAS